MAKGKLAYKYECKECGLKTVKWEGRCSQCESWNSFTEMQRSTTFNISSGQTLVADKLTYKSKQYNKRIATGIVGFDIILGGGLVQGGVALIAGEPGIGKSTLLMQLASNIADKSSVLYISGEESISQVTSRAKRLKVSASSDLSLIDSTSVEDVTSTIQDAKFAVVIIDSIQTMISESSTSSAGSVSQVSLAGQLLIRAAKKTNTTLILVGHVTKEGSIAGPKVLEHLVDVVVSIDGDRYSSLRMVRSRKNRYGPTDDLLLMDMTETGLIEVASPSEELLKERQISDGSVVLAALEGRQPLLVEVQALVSPTSFGYPKRTAVGFDINRLNLLIAMLGRRTKLSLSSHDIYLNIVGGFKLSDPGADLAVCMAIATASKGMQLKNDAVVFGEVGLSGEIRHVAGADNRIKEALSLGFKRVLGPGSTRTKSKEFSGYRNVKDALNQNLSKN